VSALVLFSWFLLAACSSRSETAKASATSGKAKEDRKPAPEFSLKDADGRTVGLAGYRGKVVLLNFWATWCGPCKLEIPWFKEFEQNYKDQGFAVLGVSMDEEGWDVVKPFLSELQVNYRILMGDDRTAQLYGGVNSLPTSFLIDREGRIASVHVGLVGKGDYEDEIEQLLAVPAGTSIRRAGAGMPAFAMGAR
jgi:peroxiredoxin